MNATIRLTEYEAADPRTHPELRRELSAEESKIVESINSSRRLEIVERRDGLRIKANRYVGVVSIGELSIQIRPKLRPELLPTFLRYALGVSRHDTVRDARAQLSELGFIDLIAMLFLDEFDGILQSGLIQEYRTKDAARAAPKGRIQFGQLARVPPGGALTVPCSFDERSHDIPLNRLLLATLNTLISSVADYSLAFDLHTRAAMLAERCEPVILDVALVSICRNTLNRMSHYYERAVDLAELILRSMGIAANGEETEALPGFLFDMAQLFEQFVAKLCSEYSPRGMTSDAQVTKRDAFAFNANPYHWRRPALRPDIVVRDASGKIVRILDTKYKLLGPNAPPSPSDLYQLTLYSLGFSNTGSVPARIIYPTLQTAPQTAVLQFRGFDDNSKSATITMFGLDIAHCAQALDKRDHNELAAIARNVIG